ncbi:hypothetical protein HOG48_05950 [Candidatus Peregrinibacteria bacterium]|jgi:hypothetical protein|nr:hypothetical protein [Candidatus Peregrinibacteria bacterium]
MGRTAEILGGLGCAALILGAAVGMATGGIELKDCVEEAHEDKAQKEELDRRTAEVKELIRWARLSREEIEKRVLKLACDHVLDEKGYDLDRRLGPWDRERICEGVTAETIFRFRSEFESLLEGYEKRPPSSSMPGQW